jgi:hypothetical protein
MLGACAPKAATVEAPAPATPATVTIGPAVTTASAPVVLPVPPPTPGICNNDEVMTVADCGAMQGVLGQCIAMNRYACPAQERVSEGKRFRAGTAARIASCYAVHPSKGESCEPYEACVREGVKASCAQEEDRAWCKANLPACNPDNQELCAKFLSSMEPKLRTQAIENFKELNGPRLKNGCKLTWDIAGYPFCPFCRFGAQ